MKTALVTGAAGFIGRHLCPKLETAGYRTIGFDLNNPWYELTPIVKVPKGPFDVIVHLAANIAPVDERMGGLVSAYDDIVLDMAMARYVRAHPPREAYIYPSSCAVDNRDDPYAWVKLTGERLCKALHREGVPVVILRLFSGYGEDQADTYPFPAILKRALARENPLTVWGSGYQVRDFVHVDDLTDAFIWAIRSAPHGTPIQIGTGRPTTMRSLARMCADAVGYEPVISGRNDKPDSSPSRVANIDVAWTYGFRAKISLQEGIARAVKSFSKPKEVAHPVFTGGDSGRGPFPCFDS